MFRNLIGKKINDQYIINISIVTTSTQISIRKEVYEKLKRAKQDNESFSDVIDRLLTSKSNVQDVLKCFGIARGPNDDFFLGTYAEAQKMIRSGFKSRIIE